MEAEGDKPQQETENLSCSLDEVDYPPNNYIYRWIDGLFVVGGMITFFVDWGFDILTAYTHWKHNDVIWFTLTVIFIGVPSLVMTVVSLHWYIKDGDNPDVPKASMVRWVVRIIVLLFQLGPVLRYFDALYHGIKSRRYWKEGDKKQQRAYYTLMLYEDSDGVFLRLFECFMEAAPQLVLQLYILTQKPESVEYNRKWQYVLSLGCVTSLVSLAWGMTAYARGSRFTNQEKNNISKLGTCVLFLWQSFSIGARVIALVLFASKFRLYVLVVCLGHWIFMAVWLISRRSFSKVCSRVLGECLLSCVLGVVYIFVFINDKDEPTRKKYVFYYFVCGIENLAMVTMFLIFTDPSTWYYIPGTVIHFILFALGLAFMGMYYMVLHPTLSKTPASQAQRMQRSQVGS
nr:XK-related protein 6-like isoform X1 [Procambarus clarkii]